MKLVLKKSEQGRKTSAFTLVEMMVVIAIIGILSGILYSAFAVGIAASNKKKAKAEFEKLDTAIKNYYATYNSYPLDNSNDFRLSPLYYELQGTTWNTAAQTYDMVGEQISEANVRLYFFQDGLRNVTHDVADAQAPKAKDFLGSLSPKAYTAIATMANAKVLVMPVKDAETNMVMCADGNLRNLWHYNASRPVYNVGKYDLWGEFEVGGTRYRISNWENDVKTISVTAK